jgi:two-component system, NtrC family, sensor kinase
MLLNETNYIKKVLKFFLVIIFFLHHNFLFADDTVILTNNSFPFDLSPNYLILKDNKLKYDTLNIQEQNFIPNKDGVPVFTLPVKSLWINFKLKNLSSSSHLYLSFGDPNISNIWVYEKTPHGLVLLDHTGALTNFDTRKNHNTAFDIDLYLQQNTEREFYVRISSPHAIELPVTVNNLESLNENNFTQILIIGLYCGIVISILLYNLFLFFATKDTSYLVYVIYLFIIGLAQISFAGWFFRFFWPSHPLFNSYIVISTSCLAGCLAIAFAKSFLNVKNYTPRLNKVLSFLSFGYFTGVVLSFTPVAWISYIIFNVFGLLLSVTLLFTSITIYRKGFRPAYFYFISWSILLSCLIVYLLKNLNIVPTNNFTHFILYFATSAEAILFSIALADRINILKKEKEISQAEALQRAKENEQLVKEQNIVLEQKVDQRTHELKESNTQLSVAIDNLKDAQTQLVEAEKMASLGQLTAGIAHEINNPINFVKSNINPLRLDVKDLLDVLKEYGDLHKINEESTYKKKLVEIEKFKQQIDVDFVQKEIDSLIVGIEEGAERTAEIVQGLRTFSRLDEAEFKTVNVHEGILSTLVILKNSTPYYVNVEKQFNAHGNIECYPGKLNQVFMNILTNSIQAITAKQEKNNPETIIITTEDIENDRMQISIKDSGIGMTEEVKHRIYEPFFTTKEVGEGTGLGMAIVFKIIQKHEGHIDIISEPCKGSEFIITLPHKHPISDHL